MATICITGSTDGIGLAAARNLLAQGHHVLVHARTEQRGRPVVDALAAEPAATGEATLVTGDLASLHSVRALAGALRAHGPIDVLVHNAGVWVRGDTPRHTEDGFETTFAVNVLAPHLLTRLLADTLTGRLLWLGSGMAGSGRPDPAALGQPRSQSPGGEPDPRQAYADSKACDVALAIGWGRRLPGVASVAVDPGWVRTKLASQGAPGRPEDGADTLAWCCTVADLTEPIRAPYWKDRRPARVPARLRDPALQDALLEACDRLVA